MNPVTYPANKQSHATGMPEAGAFGRCRETSWLVLTLAVVTYTAGSILLNWMMYQAKTEGVIRQALVDLYRTTGGLVQPTLLNGLFLFSVTGLVIFGVGRLRPSDVGLRASAIGPAVLVTLAFWIAMQGALMVVIAFSDYSLVWHGAWREPRVVAGMYLAQLLGTGLQEEVLFRGLLLPQFFLKARRRWQWAVALVFAVLGSGVVFALFHIPNRVFMHGVSGQDLSHNLLWTFWPGLAFAALFLVTRNLFVCVGIHALRNELAPLVQIWGRGWSDVWWALVVLILVAWPLARRLTSPRARPCEESTTNYVLAEPNAAPNGGPAASGDKSIAPGGPPSVS